MKHTHTQSQLRNRLATELQRSLEASVGPTPTGQASSSSPAANKKGNSMILQVANSIVVEHLKRAGYEYTLSVFLPEAGVNVDKVCLNHVRVPNFSLIQCAYGVFSASPCHVTECVHELFIIILRLQVFSYEEILQFLKISDQTLHQALLSDQKQGV